MLLPRSAVLSGIKHHIKTTKASFVCFSLLKGSGRQWFAFSLRAKPMSFLVAVSPKKKS
jgi:hypothetical protein